MTQVPTLLGSLKFTEATPDAFARRLPMKSADATLFFRMCVPDPGVGEGPGVGPGPGAGDGDGPGGGGGIGGGEGDGGSGGPGGTGGPPPPPPGGQTPPPPALVWTLRRSEPEGVIQVDWPASQVVSF